MTETRTIKLDGKDCKQAIEDYLRKNNYIPIGEATFFIPTIKDGFKDEFDGIKIEWEVEVK